MELQELPKNKELTKKQIEEIRKNISDKTLESCETLSKINDTNNSGDDES